MPRYCASHNSNLVLLSRLSSLITAQTSSPSKTNDADSVQGGEAVLQAAVEANGTSLLKYQKRVGSGTDPKSLIITGPAKRVVRHAPKAS